MPKAATAKVDIDQLVWTRWRGTRRRGYGERPGEDSAARRAPPCANHHALAALGEQNQRHRNERARAHRDSLLVVVARARRGESACSLA
eukprot:scaffold253416_cov32-Tisochrysis_lutea.AAC.6